MAVYDTYRVGVTVVRYKWFENAAGPGWRPAGPGLRIEQPAAAADTPRPRAPPRRRELEVVVDFDRVTPALIVRWLERSFVTRRPLIRLLVSSHYLEADRKRGLVLQFRHPLDAAAFSIDFKALLSPEEW
jgi:hypothetical protein